VDVGRVADQDVVLLGVEVPFRGVRACAAGLARERFTEFDLGVAVNFLPRRAAPIPAFDGRLDVLAVLAGKGRTVLGNSGEDFRAEAGVPAPLFDDLVLFVAPPAGQERDRGVGLGGGKDRAV
jgi:hypothetical protein